MIDWGLIGHIVLGLNIAYLIGALIQFAIVKTLKSIVKKKYLTKVNIVNKEDLDELRFED